MRNPLDHLAGFHLVRVAGLALRAVNAAYGDQGIRHPDAAALMVIEANPGITQSAIGRMLKIQRSNMVPIITRLADRNWIQRQPGRGKTISMFISPEGEAAMSHLRAASQAGEDVLAEHIGADGYVALHELLRRIG